MQADRDETAHSEGWTGRGEAERNADGSVLPGYVHLSLLRILQDLDNKCSECLSASTNKRNLMSIDRGTQLSFHKRFLNGTKLALCC